jgi:vacuolar-type H+-ATPase subunit H
MPQHPEDAGHSATDAINRVLNMEREARQTVTATEAAAIQHLDAARQRAARILRHADGRISLVHQLCSQGVARAIDIQVQEHHQQLAQLSQRLELDDTCLDSIVAELAAALSGAGEEPGHDAE